MAEQTVLVLGCGLGGVAAAKEIKRRLGAQGRVIAIDREPLASFTPAYIWLMTGERRVPLISRQRARLARHGVEFVTAEVREVDFENRVVRADSREIRYDFLVVALGAETVTDEPHGLAEAGQSLYSLEGAEHLAAALRYFRGGRVVLTVAGLPYKGAAVPYESLMLIEQQFHLRRMRQKVQIELYTPEPLPMAFAGAAISEEVSGFLAHRGIELHTSHELSGVNPRSRTITFADGLERGYDLLITVPRHRAPDIARDFGLVDEEGWIRVKPETLETSREGVYAIGDITRIATANGAELPKSAFAAEQQAKAVARQIAARAGGAKEAAPYEGEEQFFIEVGSGAAARVHGRLLGSQPGLELNQPSIVWHWARRGLERKWLWRTY